MYADCPNCKTEFHITAKHISAASGKVQCGICDHVFNAVARLHDEAILQKLKPAGTDSIDAGVNVGARQADSEHSDEPDLHPTGAEAIIAADAEPPDPQADSPAVGEAADAHRRGQGSDHNEPVFEAEIDPDVDLAYAAVAGELEQAEPAKNRSLALFWSAGALSLLLIAVAQVLWFQRDLVLQHYPEAVPYARQLCERFQCAIIRKRDLSAIELLNRDVRLHPTFGETLLVNATMMNQLAGIQPYPTVQFNLFDTGGAIIGSRKFTPQQYLDQSIAVHAGMQPGSPVHFVLEITGQTLNAVSFEFRFL